jgi:hypothetical protein
MKANLLLRTMVLLCIYWACAGSVTAQENTNTPMEAFIARAKLQYSFKSVDNIWQEADASRFKSVEPYVTKAQLFTLDAAALGNFMAQNNKSIRLVLPDGNNGKFEIDLSRFDIYSHGFKVREVANGVQTDFGYTPGLIYRGVVNGIPGSLAAFSFFNNEVYGLFSIPGVGNYTITPNTLETQPGNSSYILYNDKDLKIHPEGPGCMTDHLPQLNRAPESNTASRNTFQDCKDIEVLLVADYATYLSRSSSTTNVSNYLTAVYNVLSVLYRNEGIYTSIKAINVNTTTDTYQTLSSNSIDFLTAFGQATQNNMSGADLAHLVTTRYGGAMGGVAWLDVLCDPYFGAPQHAGPYAFSNIYANETAGSFPTYTWNVECMTHEMGHNIGSNHTQWCGWTGGAIDGCYALEAAGGPVCAMPVPQYPVGGGTIMSYCHLVGGVGINFSYGFGPQPGNLIRTRASAGACATAYTPENMLVTNNISLAATRECTNAGITYYWNDNDNSDEADNRLALRILKGANNIGTLDDVGFAVNTSTLANYGSNTGTAVTFPAGIAGIGNTNAAMNRYWNVTPVTQPATAVEVQFPFNNQDVTDVAGSIAGVTAFSDLKFYKMATAVNPNPAAGFTGATAANTIIYNYNATTAGLNTWTHTLVGTTRLARFLVNSFSGGGGFGTTSPLPLDIISFKGRARTNDILLDWEVALEKNVKEFVVEKSLDGVHYKDMSIVASRNLPSGFYNTPDKEPVQGNNYYRLSYNSMDGVRKILAYTQVAINGTSAISIYPNPAKEVVYVDLKGIEGAAKIRIMDLNGRVVYSIEQSKSNISIDLKTFARGVYMIQVITGNELINQKIELR